MYGICCFNFYGLILQVNVELAVKVFKENAVKAINVLKKAIPRIAAEDWKETIAEHKVSAGLRQTDISSEVGSITSRHCKKWCFL